MTRRPKTAKEYLETFLFPGIDVPYPVYAFNEDGKLINLKAIIYPSSRSKKKFTRGKQLANRSMQAKIFDAIINIGYFNPLTVITEFPVIIQNSLRLPGQHGMYMLLDYYFPELHLAVELDSDLHNKGRDELRDKYLGKLGIDVYRIDGLHKVNVQKKEFRELAARMREIGTLPLLSFDFQTDLKKFVVEKGPIELLNPNIWK